MKFSLAAALACGSLWLGAACGGEDRRTGCEALDEACDIRQSSCQRAVFELTACVRGQRDASPPPVRLITRDQLREELTSGEPRELGRTQKAWEKASALLGLLPAESTLDQANTDAVVDGVAAYYSPRDAAITIIDDAASDFDDGTFVLSHEYVHALQDQREDFGDLYSNVDSTDGVVALDSLVEGEATWLSNVAMARLRDAELDGERAGSYFEDMLARVLDAIAMSPAPLVEATMVLPYPVGGRGLSEAYLTDRLAGIEAFYMDPPQTLASWVVTDGGALPEPLDCDVPEAPAGYERVLTDRLGIAGLIALNVAFKATGASAFDAATSWTADRIAVYAPSEQTDESVAVAWLVRLADASSARALADAASAGLNLRITPVGSAEVLISAASDQAVHDAWSALETCPAEAKSRAPREPSPLAAWHRRQRLERFY